MTLEAFIAAVAQRILADDLEILVLDPDVKIERQALPEGGVRYTLVPSYAAYDESAPVFIELDAPALDAARSELVAHPKTEAET